MYLQSKKFSLFVLGGTAVIFSKVLFVFFNDPEGPNLLVVTVVAAVIYLPSLLVFTFKALPVTTLKRLLLAIFIQLVIVGCFHMFM